MTHASETLKLKLRYEGAYLNLYRDGRDIHSHQTAQIVISLGATRVLKVGSKEYSTENGDMIIFGKSNHELLPDETVHTARISIALFASVIE